MVAIKTGSSAQSYYHCWPTLKAKHAIRIMHWLSTSIPCTIFYRHQHFAPPASCVNGMVAGFI